MIFTVLSYITLEPVIELDDYISAIWNNKYFSTGEFEIVCRTTQERIRKITRNNFINLNGTKDIGVIELINYTKDEDQGAIMTIKGSFAQSLFSKRIVWNKTLLKGSVDYGVQRLLVENGINPKDQDRYLALDGDKHIIIDDDSISVGDELNEPSEFEMQGNPIIWTEGSDISYGIYNTPYYFSNFRLEFKIWGKIFILRPKGDTSIDPPIVAQYLLENGVNSIARIGERGNYLINKYSAYVIKTHIFTASRASTIMNNTATTVIKKGTSGSIVEFRYDFEEGYATDTPPFSRKIVGITKEDFDNNKFGVCLYEDSEYGLVLGFRFFWSNALINYAKANYSGKYSTWQIYAYILFFGHEYNSQFNVIGDYDEIVVQKEKSDKTPIEIYSYSDSRVISFSELAEYIKKYDWIYTSDSNACQIALTYRTSSENKRNYLAIGTRPSVGDKIELQLYGDNLLSKVEELLTLYGLGLQARYEKEEKLIYFDVINGLDRSKNIKFSEELDNLVSYDIGLSSSKPNVALVYSKIETKEGEITKIDEYEEQAGASAGVNRTELYINKSGEAGYIGADYTTQLIEEGNLSFNKVTVTIENEIDPDAYLYRQQFFLGDIVEVIIKDLNLTFKTRILEVREYSDENGYTIDLVLGE